MSVLIKSVMSLKQCSMPAMMSFMLPHTSKISLAASAESSDSFLISSATTENPAPAVPALAASIEAFMARMFVCDEISCMRFTFSLILLSLLRLSMAAEISPWVSSALSFMESARLCAFFIMSSATEILSALDFLLSCMMSCIEEMSALTF